MSALRGTLRFTAGIARGVKAAVTLVIELPDDSNVNTNDNARREIEQRMSQLG